MNLPDKTKETKHDRDNTPLALPEENKTTSKKEGSL